jgi:NADPH:quinone reductase-like Zn-dependent oxidoreductase
MALLVCIAGGITIIITSFSYDKTAKLKKLDQTVQGTDYKTTEAKNEVPKLTNNKGVDFILHNVGISSIPQYLEIVRKSGSTALMGFLERRQHVGSIIV